MSQPQESEHLASNLAYLRRPIDEVIRDIARTVIDEHVKTCPVPERVERLDGQVRKLEIRWGYLLGLMVGGGCVGGAVGGSLASWIF